MLCSLETGGSSFFAADGFPAFRWGVFDTPGTVRKKASPPKSKRRQNNGSK